MKEWKKQLTAAALGLLLSLPLPVYASVQEDGVHLTVLHTNDIHARVLPTDDEGKTIGMAWLTGAIRREKEIEPDTLALDAGDTFHGRPIINLSRGANMASLLNLSGYDAMTPGNHDFDFGSQRLIELGRMLNFPILSANVLDQENSKTIFPPYKSFEMNGVKVAVVGLTTPETAYKTNPRNVTSILFADPIATMKVLMPKLRAEHDVVIGLMHMGVDKSSIVTSIRLAKAVPGFDIIIDGHSHTTLPHGIREGKTLICQTGCHGYHLGKVELVVKNHKLRKATAQLLDHEGVKKLAGTPDERTEEAITEMQRETRKALAEVVAESSKQLISKREIVRTRETELGNLAADAMRDATGADIAVINSGGLRADLPQGKVTREDVLSIFPFGNIVEKIEVRGSVIEAMLEHSVRYLPAAFGGFLDVSGLTFDLDANAKPGSRVSNVLVQGRPLSPEATYTLALNDFEAAGGDGYEMLKGAKELGQYGTLEDIFSQYLQKHGVEGIALGRISVK